MTLNCLLSFTSHHTMSMIKAWLHEQMEKECREEEMFFNADKHYELEQAMREEMDPPEQEYESPINEINDSNEPPF